MSAGATRNFGIAVRERARRLSEVLDDPYNTSAGTAVSDPSWNAFFGGMREQEAGAHAAGLNYYADLGDIGRPPSSPHLTGGPNAFYSTSQQSVLGNEAAARGADENAARQLAVQAALDNRDAINRDEMRQSYQQHVMASGLQPPLEPSAITREPGPSGNDKYTVRRDPAAPPLSYQERVLDVLPPERRLAYQQSLAEQNLKSRQVAVDEGKLTETTRHNQATEESADDDVKAAVEGMVNGTLPPQLPGRASKDYTKILAEAKRQGYNLQGAVTDWNATQKHFATLNGAQQTRIRQSVDTAYHSLDIIDDLAKQWNGGRFPLLNRATLASAKQGILGKDAQLIATQLDAQITDLTSELANVYMGGNSPTDHALKLAEKNLSGDWSKDVLPAMTKQARTNLQIRLNSMNTMPPIASPNNPYAPPPAPGQGAPPQVRPVGAVPPPGAGNTPEGTQRAMPGVEGGVAEFRNGRWVRVK